MLQAGRLLLLCTSGGAGSKRTINQERALVQLRLPTQPRGHTGNDTATRTCGLGSRTTRNSTFLPLRSIGSPRKALVPTTHAVTLQSVEKNQQFLAGVRAAPLAGLVTLLLASLLRHLGLCYAACSPQTAPVRTRVLSPSLRPTAPRSAPRSLPVTFLPPDAT